MRRAPVRESVMRSVMRVPVVCLCLLALSVLGFFMGLYSLVPIALVLVAVIVALPAWSGSITGKAWRCTNCGAALPSTMRYALILPSDVTFCPRCETPVR